MLMFTLVISCLTISDLPWFMDLTFQVPMQYCSLQNQTLLLLPVPSTTGCCFCFGSIPSFLYTYICSFISFSYITEYWVEFPVLYSRPLLVIYFIYSSVYVSIPVSQFIPPSPPWWPLICIVLGCFCMAELSGWDRDCSLYIYCQTLQKGFVNPWSTMSKKKKKIQCQPDMKCESFQLPH